MKNHFKIEGPAVISFSGGRTSGYMLWRILQAHQWILPDDVKVVFANTGKEMPETLDFVRDCGVHWNVPITWLEYRAGKIKYEVVTHSNASRNGEPFAALIERKGWSLPTSHMRMCTQSLKVETLSAFIKRELRWSEWDGVLGLRADEPDRVSKAHTRNAADNPITSVMPLAAANIGKDDVWDFWQKNSFDLKLAGIRGRTYGSNCDLCFLKGTPQLLALIREKPERAVWWINIENEAAQKRKTKTTRFGEQWTFRPNSPSYETLHRMATQHGELFAFDDEGLQDCACTD